MALHPLQVVGVLVALAAATSVACVTPDAVPGGGGSGGDPTGNGGAGGSHSTGGTTAGVDFAWAHSYGIDSHFDNDHARSIAPAANGGALIAGDFSGSLEVGALPPLSNTLGRDGFVIEHDANGKPTWATAFAGDGDQLVLGAAATPDGGVVVAGSLRTKLVFDGMDHGDEPDGEDGFVASFDKTRGLEWLVLLQGPSDQAVHALAVTPAGDIVIAGYFGDKLTLGEVALEGGAGRDFFVAKLDGAGKGLWATSLGGDPSNLGLGEPVCYLALSGDEAIHLAGNFTGTLRFAETLAAVGNRDVFVGTLSEAGKPGWGRAIGVLGQEQRAAGLAVDGNGRVLLAGDLVGAAKLGEGSELSSDGSAPDAFLAAYGKGGSLLWAERYGSPAEDHAGAVAFDPQGNILFTGRFRGTIAFTGQEPAPLQNPDAVSSHDDLFLAKLTPEAKPLFSKAFGKGGDQVATAIASGPDGEVLLAGYFRGMVDFGGSELDAKAGEDIFVARFGK